MMIEVNNIGKNYGAVEAVKSVSFTVDSGEIIGLLGPNGAGKTTIMRILTCYHFPSYGDVKINNHDIYGEALQVKQSVGYLPENVPLYLDLNVKEYLDFIVESRNIPKAQVQDRIDYVIDECGLEPVFKRGIDKLSKGFMQRVGLAQAILHDPDILIFDEPTTGLDPNQILEIRRLIRRLGEQKTVILSTHILQEVEAVCDRVLILNEGQIAAEGTTEEIGSEMKGENIYSVTVKGEEESPSEEVISGIPTLQRIISYVKKGGNTAQARIAMGNARESEKAIGEIIFDWAVDTKCKLLEVTPEKYSLEDIFTNLTQEGGTEHE